MAKLRIGLAGTPDIAATIFHELIAQYEITVIYTKPDAPHGRGKKLTPSPVKVLAAEHNIPVVQPKNFKAAADVANFKNHNLDLLIVVAYGIILPQEILDLPKYGCINVHYSLLPRWRGAAPVQHAILAGDSHTGVCLMQMDAGLDTGNIISQQSLAIKATDNSSYLFQQLNLAAIKLLKTLLQTMHAKPGIVASQVQAENGVTYAHKFNKNDGLIDINASATDALRKINAFDIWPVAFVQLQQVTVKIYSAKIVVCQPQHKVGTIILYQKQQLALCFYDGLLILDKIQIPGKKPMPAINLRQKLLSLE